MTRKLKIPSFIYKGTVALAFCASLSGVGEGFAQTNAEQVIAIGRNVLSMEDYMLAIHYFNQAIKAKPYLSEPYYLRGLAKLNLEDLKGAEDDCTAAITRNKFRTEAYKLRGFVRQSLGKDSLAVDDYNVGLAYNPTDRYFLFYKGVALTTLKQYDKAAASLDSLIRLYPGFDEGFAARGQLNLQRADTVAALEDIDKAIAINRMQISPYLMRAEINTVREKWGEASADMGEAIRLQPDRPELYLNRAYLRYNDDDFFGAMSDYNYALQIQPDYVPALFNRALLRHEVKDLQNAESDFSGVLALEPDNFHARYNRGLVRLELGKYKDAKVDFQEIARIYPRFYPVYYAIAECERSQGNLMSAARNIQYADVLVARYVSNPEKNPLDRPAIAPGKSNDRNSASSGEESDTEIMDRFNQLVTSSQGERTELAFNERYRGKVQDRSMQIDTEPAYFLSLLQPEASMSDASATFRELQDFNNAGYSQRHVYLASGSTLKGEEDFDGMLEIADNLSSVISAGKGRPVDYFMRGVAYTALKDYSRAVSDFNVTVEMAPDFSLAYFARGYVHSSLATLPADSDSGKKGRESLSEATLAEMDFDKALQLNPLNEFAWFNKGNIRYSQKDFIGATRCYSKAIESNPELGEAWYNRGLCSLQAGKRAEAFSDISKAGELGVLPSYGLLKRMK